MRPFKTSTRRLALSVILLGGLSGVASAAGHTFRRDLKGFFAFAEREMHLKNLTLSDACNVGVNCAQPSPNSECGNIILDDAQFADGSQIGADVVKFTKPGASVWEVFHNKPPAIAASIIRDPGMQPDGSDLLGALPILPNLDGDANPSCDSNCNPDVGDLEAACGFPDPFPSCDPSKPVTVPSNSDCVGAADGTPGNSRCDLAPGTYGDLQVQNFGKLNLTGGGYVFCSVNVGKNATILADSPAIVDIADGGFFNLNNESSFGQKCGDIAVRLKGTDSVAFGRNASVTAFVCAPGGTINLGHANQLTGQFIGDSVFANQDNDGHCCAGGVCTCFDSFAPTSAKVGDTITLTSMCDLTSATGVKICGINAIITSKTAGELKVTVPAGATGSCSVQVESAAGVYTAGGTLTIVP
jgi:hypothetical protein